MLRVTTWLFFFSSRRGHTRSLCDWSSDVCSSDLSGKANEFAARARININVNEASTRSKLVGLAGYAVVEAQSNANDQVGRADSAIDVSEIGRASCRERV